MKLRDEFLQKAQTEFLPAVKEAVSYMLGTLEQIEARYALNKAIEADLADVPVLKREVSVTDGMEAVGLHWIPRSAFHTIHFSFADAHEVFCHLPMHATKQEVAKQLRETAELLDPVMIQSYGGTL